MTLELEIAHAMSLKDKRAVLNRIRDRVHNKFNVSVAEIEAHEMWNVGIIGVGVVSNAQKHCNQVLSKVLAHVEENHPEAEVVDCDMEFLTT